MRFPWERPGETAPERWLPGPYAEPSQRFQVADRLPDYPRYALLPPPLFPLRPQRAHLTTAFCHLAILFGLGACAEKPAVAPVQAPGAPASSATSAQAPTEVHMAPVPAGSYQMGAVDGEPDEKPVHSVKVDAFELDVNEVSTGDYQACVTSGKCTPAGTDGHCNSGHSDRLADPINCVDWTQATAYCANAGKRLPTEEEWEYAARGTDARKFPWGNTAPTAEVTCWNRFAKHEGTCRIGTTNGKSPFGIADMAGNVWEWTSSAYCDYPSTSCSGSRRVNRGGGWNADEPAILRAANRIWAAPDHRNSNLGFRCARSSSSKPTP